VLAFLVFFFSGRKIELIAQQNPDIGISKKENVDKKDTIGDPVEEYNQLAKYYNTYPQVDFISKVKDMWKIRNLYESISNSQHSGLEKYPIWSFSHAIFISNDGRYLIDRSERIGGKFIVERKAVSLDELAALFASFSEQERSNMYLIDEMQDDQAFNSGPGKAFKESGIFHNAVFIRIYTEERIPDPNPESEKVKLQMEAIAKKRWEKEGLELQFTSDGSQPYSSLVQYAKENKKLDTYREALRKVLSKYIQVDC
ncbi:MAG: hypothetical protein AAFU64_08840, partial [Bacteroidota bacterium]